MRTRTRSAVSALIVCASLLHAPAHTARYVRQRTLTNPTSQAAFGYALATVGSNLAVGDNTDDTGGGGFHGSVSLFDGTTMALLRYIPAPTAGTVYFGTAVAAYAATSWSAAPAASPTASRRTSST